MLCPAGDPVLQERFFEVLVLDEATQAPEPAALVAAAQKVGAGKCCTSLQDQAQDWWLST